MKINNIDLNIGDIINDNINGVEIILKIEMEKIILFHILFPRNDRKRKYSFFTVQESLRIGSIKKV